MQTPADQGFAAGRKEANEAKMHAAYEDAVMAALSVAERLGDRIRDNWPAPDSEKIDWCYVGSMQHILAELKQAEQAITGKDG